MSHPAWVRGLKQDQYRHLAGPTSVAPCVGAWIETYRDHWHTSGPVVAPCVGAWIETSIDAQEKIESLVAPCVGAWIETQDLRAPMLRGSSRTLRGCVD